MAANCSPSAQPSHYGVSSSLQVLSPSDSAEEETTRRRGSTGSVGSPGENTGHWITGDEQPSSKSPLANFGFFKSLTEKKTTRGMVLPG